MTSRSTLFALFSAMATLTLLAAPAHAQTWTGAQVVTGGDHGAEPFHVPTRVCGFLAGDLDPAVWFDVVRSRFAHGLASVERPEARERIESC